LKGKRARRTNGSEVEKDKEWEGEKMNWNIFWKLYFMDVDLVGVR
jgi:hypothetical protein